MHPAQFQRSRLAARFIFGAVLSVSCACAWIRETPSVGLCGTLAGNAAMGVFSLFDVILRIRAFIGASWSAHGTPSTDSSCSDLEVKGLYQPGGFVNSFYPISVAGELNWKR